MTTANKADRQAAEKGSGQGSGPGNAGGAATGPGSSSAGSAAAPKDNLRDIGGSGSAKAERGRPGHKSGA
jgi:hypothetical protein